jgi:hypothetical protein
VPSLLGWAKERFVDLYLYYFIDRASARAAIAPGPLGAPRDFTSVLGARRGVACGERDWKIDFLNGRPTPADVAG